MLLSGVEDGLIPFCGLLDSLRPGELIGLEPVIAVDRDVVPRLHPSQLAARQLVAIDIVQVEADDVFGEETGIAPAGTDAERFDGVAPLTEVYPAE